MPHLEGLTYDPGAAGGCTIVEVDRTGKRVGERVGIAGTRTNCAGGQTPWGTWLTCEEVYSSAGADGFQKDHCYVFDVDPHDGAANWDPQPIKRWAGSSTRRPRSILAAATSTLTEGTRGGRRWPRRTRRPI